VASIRWAVRIVTLVGLGAGLCGCAGTRGGAAPGTSGGTPAGGGEPGPPGGATSGVGPNQCTFAAGVRLVERRSDPKLFSKGADPSRDPECSNIANPERGFFAFRDLLNMTDLGDLRASGVSLVYGQALLDRYRDRALDFQIDDKVRAGFQAVRAAGLKVLPRFYYAADDKAPDARPSRAIEHIKALTPALRDNADVIAVMHAGFVGAWGEWHPENRASMAERKGILEALLEALPDTRMIVVRRPFYKQMAFGGPMTAELARSRSPLARIGHLNDCFLASPNDQGTYRAVGEEDYALADGHHVPVGGETCAVNPPRTECASALRELERHHWSFLNRDYQEQVIAGWREGGCYDTIACRLGYRFVVRGHAFAAEARAGEPFPLRLSLTNDGYAAAFNRRPVFLAFAAAGAAPVLVPTGIDARAWEPGHDLEACLSVNLPANLPPGTTRVGVWLPDPETSLQTDPRYAIRLVGGASFDAVSGINWLDGTISVSR
jgi:hypothetical protein